ncbi:MAG TPA: hypothetical protein VH877_11630 [Polyangia bacterium]|jgi:hypothetical protein|nr:hypothetical protein [Polyangia bacterium]
MPRSYSLGNQLNFISLSVSAAKSYETALPSEAAQSATRLAGYFDRIKDLSARQEKAKQQQVLATRELAEVMGASRKERARLIRLAEATFGPRDPRIKEFRPATEGKVRKPRGEGAARKAKKAAAEQK